MNPLQFPWSERESHKVRDPGPQRTGRARPAPRRRPRLRVGVGLGVMVRLRTWGSSWESRPLGYHSSYGEGVRDLSLLEADEREGACPQGKRKLSCLLVLGKGVLEQGTKAFVRKGSMPIRCRRIGTGRHGHTYLVGREPCLIPIGEHSPSDRPVLLLSGNYGTHTDHLSPIRC